MCARRLPRRSPRRRVERLAAHAKQNGVHETRERARVRNELARRARIRWTFVSASKSIEIAGRALRARARSSRAPPRARPRSDRRAAAEDATSAAADASSASTVASSSLSRSSPSLAATARGRRRRLARERSARRAEPRRLQHHEPPAEPQTAVGGDQALRPFSNARNACALFCGRALASFQIQTDPNPTPRTRRGSPAGVRGFLAPAAAAAASAPGTAAELQRRGFAGTRRNAVHKHDSRETHARSTIKRVCFIRLVLQKHALVRERLEAGARRRSAVQREEHGGATCPVSSESSLAELGSIPRGVRGVPEPRKRRAEARHRPRLSPRSCRRLESVVAVAAGTDTPAATRAKCPSPRRRRRTRSGSHPRRPARVSAARGRPRRSAARPAPRFGATAPSRLPGSTRTSPGT